MEIGAVVVALASLLGLLATIHKLFISPLNDLTVNLERLNTNLERISGDHLKLEERVEEQDRRLDIVEVTLARNNIT